LRAISRRFEKCAPSSLGNACGIPAVGVVVVAERRRDDAVAGEHQRGGHCVHRSLHAGADVELVDEAEFAHPAGVLVAHGGRTVLQPGAAQRHRLEVAVGARRRETELAELAGDVARRDLVARGAGLAAAQQVVGEKGDVRLEARFEQRVPGDGRRIRRRQPAPRAARGPPGGSLSGSSRHHTESAATVRAPERDRRRATAPGERLEWREHEPRTG